MIIDDDLSNLIIAKKALEKDYDVIPVTSGQSALDLMKRIVPDLILLDINMPKMNGFEVISKLKTSDNFKNIPVIFLTAQDDSSDELEGFSLGATDYIKKPFIIPILIKKIELYIKIIKQTREIENYNKNLENTVQQKIHSISKLEQCIIETIADLISKKEMYSGSTTSRVQFYFTFLIRELIKNKMAEDINENNINIISSSSKLFDLGKLVIPDNLTINSDIFPYEGEEYLKLHTVLGSDSIEKSMKFSKENNFLKYAWQMARHHHERWDGKGYPDNLSGKNIPFVARVIAVSNVYDILTSERGTINAISPEQAVEIIEKYSGTFFDPEIVTVFKNSYKKMIETFN